MKKVLKKSAILLLVLSLVFSLAGCGEVQKAETAVNNMFAAFKTLNFEEAQKYINLEDIKEAKAEGNLTGDSEMIMKNLFDKLNYEIISSEKIDENTVNVQTKITAIDMTPVLGEFFMAAMQYAFQNAFVDPQPSDEEINKKMEEIFIELTSEPDLATVTNEVTIKVVKEDENWKITSDDALVDALLGGLTEAAKQLENSSNE